MLRHIKIPMYHAVDRYRLGTNFAIIFFSLSHLFSYFFRLSTVKSYTYLVKLPNRFNRGDS